MPIRLYKTARARRSAVTQLKKLGLNYFVGFRNTGPKPAGLSFGLAAWTPVDQPYIRDIYYKGDHIIH